MKKIALAAGLVLAASAALAQTAAPPAAPDIPKPKCEVPHVPGMAMREDVREMDRFNKATKAYKDCMQAYIADRQAASKAEVDAANAAAEEYNKNVTQLQQDLK